jgi:glycosyltransferase involved in cell wall biosynthesis
VTSPASVVMLVHEARRTGPPVYALELLRWLRSNTELDLSVVLLDGGPLQDEFARWFPTRMVDDPATVATLRDADLVYVNTAASIAALTRTGVRPARVITHVHELEIGLRHYLPPQDYELMLEVTDRYLVGPELARDNLVDNHGFDPGQIGCVPYFVPRHEDASPGGPSPREVLGIGEDTLLVGACGSRDWRKGPDLFAQLAWEVRRQAPGVDVHFAWVGDPNPSADHWNAAVDLDLLDLGGRLTLVPQQADPLRWMQEMAVFAMTSRDDTFPLVCLEAGSLGVPVVCFESGGIPALLAASGGGRSVGFVDVAAMAAEVVELLADAGLRRTLGDRLRTYVDAEHGIDRCAGMVADEIRRLLA